MRKYFLILFFCSLKNFVFSQEVILSSFGKVSDTGGSLEYSIGQVFGNEITSANSIRITEGIYQPHQKITYVFNQGWLPNNPGGVSLAEDILQVDMGNATISSTTFCDTLKINSGASLTIATDFILKANKTILNSTSTSYASLIPKGTLNGSIEYNRFVAKVGPVGTNDLISSPVVSQNFGDFAANNINLASSGSLRAFAPYNTTTGSYENFDIGVNFETQLTLGKGYRAATIDGSSLKFTGSLHHTDVNITILDATVGGGWNLIGNPYPSYLDFESFFNQNKDQLNSSSGAFQAIYGYDGDASDGWTVWNLATITNTNETELIAPGQGFFVKSKIGGGSIVFKPLMQRVGSSDDFIPGKSKSKKTAYSSLVLSSKSKSSALSIYFLERATEEIDAGYDASVFLNDENNLSFYSKLISKPSNDLDLAVQSLPYKNLQKQKIPLGVKSSLNEELVIRLDKNKSKIPDEIDVYLYDSYNKSLTNLKENNYTFLSESNASNEQRFFVNYTSTVLSIDELKTNNELKIVVNERKKLFVSGLLNTNTFVSVFDINGRDLISKKITGLEDEFTIDLSQLKLGIYLVKIFDGKKYTNKKIVLK